MTNEIRNLLEDEIKREIVGLSDLPLGSKEKSAAVDDVVKLYRTTIEEDKNKTDSNERRCERENEERIKWSQFSEEAKSRRFRLCFDAASLIAPLIFYAHWMRKGFEFEKNGAFTSTTFRSLFNRFRPTGKN